MNRSIVVVGVIALALLIGGVAYNWGVSNGIAQSGKIVAAAPASAPYPYPYPYYWHPWGGGFFFFPLFFFFVWVLIIRGLFWGARWRHAGGSGWGCGGGFDEWHRRAHERMTMENSGDDPGRR